MLDVDGCDGRSAAWFAVADGGVVAGGERCEAERAAGGGKAGAGGGEAGRSIDLVDREGFAGGAEFSGSDGDKDWVEFGVPLSFGFAGYGD